MPQDGLGNAEVERYKMLAHLAEERSREIRRVAAMERAQLEERLLKQQPTIDAYAAELERLRATCERLRKRSERHRSKLAETRAKLSALKEAQNRILSSRAHRLAAAYVHSVQGSSLRARILQKMRSALRHLRHLGR